MKTVRIGKRVGGFAIIELMVSLGFLTVTALAVGVAVQAGVQQVRTTRDLSLVQAKAKSFLDRISNGDFGLPVDPNPCVCELTDLFDTKMIPSDLTLYQLSMFPKGDGGWKFTLTDFPVDGEWRITVDHDLDGNGDECSTLLEKTTRVFSVRIYFNEELVLKTNRAKEVRK